MSLAKKLNLKDGMKVRVVNKPKGVDLGDVQTTTSAKADAVLVFVKNKAEVDAKGSPFIEAAKDDKLSWAAYPKAGKLETDLHRDILWQHVEKHGIEGVRLVSLDETWSVMRFRPKAAKK